MNSKGTKKKEFLEMFNIEGSTNDGDHKERTNDGSLYDCFDDAASEVFDMIDDGTNNKDV